MKLPLLLVALAFLPGLALAQATPGSDATTATSPDQTEGGGHKHWHHRTPEQQLAWLTSKLDLTDTQQTQIGTVLTSRDTQFKTIHQDASLTKEEKHQQMKALMESSNQQIESYLTSGQLAQFQALHQHHAPAAQPQG